MFRTSCVHHQEDHFVHALFNGVFFMPLCQQPSRWDDVHIVPSARLLTCRIHEELN